MKHPDPPRKNLLQTVVKHLDRIFRPTSATPQPTPAKPPVYKTNHQGIALSPTLLRQYVMDNISDTELSVVSMAKGLNTSRTMLYQATHDAFGTSPADLINDLRIEHACQLLSQGLRASYVARCCGFADPKYFSKVFKKRFGILPSKYFSNQ